MTANKDIIRSEKIDIIQLGLLNKWDITLSNIAFFSKCDFNLISFGQLREVGNLYYNYPKSMILKKTENIIGLV